MKLKSLIKSALPPSLFAEIKSAVVNRRLSSNVSADLRRYRRASYTARGPQTQEQLRAEIIFTYHRLEKGLALPGPRPGFGAAVVSQLIEDIASYEDRYGRDDLGVTVDGVLQAYLESGFSAEAAAIKIRDHLARHQGHPGAETASRSGGTVVVSSETLFPLPSSDAVRFLTSRHSIRHFTGAPVSSDLIKRAVALAQCAPSVCNRQSGRIYVANDAAIIADILKHQNGNRGFGDKLGAVFIVASDLQVFRSVGERNQAFVDGGIFAMSLVLGLHALGLGTCMLNWSMEQRQDQRLRQAIGISESHVVITMVGAGHIPGHPFQIAASPRIPVDRVIQWLH